MTYFSALEGGFKMKCLLFKICEKREYLEFLEDEKIGGKKHPIQNYVKEQLGICNSGICISSLPGQTEAVK